MLKYLTNIPSLSIFIKDIIKPVKKDREMYELIILSLLMRTPMHGYLITKIANDQIGPWAKISSGTLYTILTKLERAGYIAVMQDGGQAARGDRQARTFMITDEGRKRFHQIMMDTSSNQGDYQKIFQYKTQSIDLLQSKERLLLFNHYINYCQTYILYLQTEMENLVHELASYPYSTFQKNVLNTMKHLEKQWEEELGWARSLREQEIIQIEASSSTTSEETQTTREY